MCEQHAVPVEGLQKAALFRSNGSVLMNERGESVTLPKTNVAPEKLPKPNRKVVFQPSIFRGYVSFREGIHFS